MSLKVPRVPSMARTDEQSRVCRGSRQHLKYFLFKMGPPPRSSSSEKKQDGCQVAIPLYGLSSTGPPCRWCRDWYPRSTPAAPWRQTSGGNPWRCSWAWCGKCSWRVWGRWWWCSGSWWASAAAPGTPGTCSSSMCSSAPPPLSRWRRLPWWRGRSTPGPGNACRSHTWPQRCTWRGDISNSLNTHLKVITRWQCWKDNVKHPIAATVASVCFKVLLLDFLLWFGVDLDAFPEEHGVHAGLGVCSCGVQQQVGQLCKRHTRVTTSLKTSRNCEEPACQRVHSRNSSKGNRSMVGGLSRASGPN